MKKGSLFALLIVVFILTGCVNLALNDDKKDAKKDVSVDNSWKKPVAERLLSEFNEYYQKMQTNDNLFYNRIMAADRATGLLCVYKDYISDESLKDIKNKQDEINEKIGDSTVSFGYTKSGLHIVALMDMQNNSSMEYEPACDFIRRNNQESKMFEDIYYNHDCYLTDVYIEDLSNNNENFNVSVDQILIDGPDFRPMQEVKNISNETKGAVKKYNRVIEPKNGMYSNKTWRLISAEWIYNFLRVYVDGEKIDLVTTASDRQVIKNNVPPVAQ